MCRPRQDARPSGGRLPGRRAPPGLTLPVHSFCTQGCRTPALLAQQKRNSGAERPWWATTPAQSPGQAAIPAHPRPPPQGGLRDRGGPRLPAPKTRAPQHCSLVAPPSARARARPPRPRGGLLEAPVPAARLPRRGRKSPQRPLPSARLPSPRPPDPLRVASGLSGRAADRRKPRATRHTTPTDPSRVRSRRTACRLP